jgi:microcystin degradation protein MlrC
VKVFTVGLGAETNTFSPIPTGYSKFEETYLVRNGEHGDKPYILAAPLIVFREKAKRLGWTVVESLCAFAEPGGLVVGSIYETLREEILNDLCKAMPVDLVLLSLHGAMVAEGYNDCEGDLLTKIRGIVGPIVPIGAEIDPHSHLTQKMLSNASILISYKEYPHIDYSERAEELFDIIADCVEGKVTPTASIFDCRMIGKYHTPTEPMKDYIANIKRLEQDERVLSVSVIHGFCWGDVPDMGTKILVYTDGFSDYGNSLAEKLGRSIFEQREALRPNYQNIDIALQRITVKKAAPLVIADVSDNAGGGASSDSTFILRWLLEKGIYQVGLGCIWDPVAVLIAKDAGIGAKLDLRVGGKIGPMSGDPIDLHVTVIGMQANSIQSFGPAGAKTYARLGDSVAVSADGIDIVLNSIRTQVFSPECFSNVGIDPLEKQILVVKSAQHFYAAFAPISSEIIYVADQGVTNPNLKKLVYNKIDKNKWPFVKDPFS